MLFDPAHGGDIKLWSILSTTPTYPSEFEVTKDSLDIRVPKKCTHKTKGFLARSKPVVSTEDTPIDTHVDNVFDSLDCQISQTPPNLRTAFDEISDISTTYLGPCTHSQTEKPEKESCDTSQQHKLEQTFPISTDCTTQGRLANNTKVNILLDTGATRSYLSYKFYEENKILHSLPKYPTRSRGITIGNGNKVMPKFIIPIQVMIHDHIFEIFTLVTAINPIIDLVVGIKNMYELEGAIDTRSSTFKFFDRSPWMRLDNVKEDGLTLRPGDQKEIVLKVPYFTRLDGAAVVKFY